jgi:hypothetical protein
MVRRDEIFEKREDLEKREVAVPAALSLGCATAAITPACKICLA